MDMTLQSARSPTSSSRYTCNPQPPYEYPSPAHSTSNYQRSEALRGIGVYSRPLSESFNENYTNEDGNSPTATNSSECKWPTAGNKRSDTSRSSLSTPNVLSQEYDPFAPCLPSSARLYSYDIYSTPTAEALSASPLHSHNTSQRSSISSATSGNLTQADSIHSYTPKIKMEELNDHSDYVTGSEAMMMSSPLSHNQLVTAGSSYSGGLDASYYSEHNPMGWSKMHYGNNDGLPSISSLQTSHYDRRSESCERGSASVSKSQITTTKTRQPRRLTTKEEANYQCREKGCEKFFGRSYNFKAHMDTHAIGRSYPFPCPVKDCDKKFVRKTDLQRHNASVHMKEKNHRCDYCARHFARRDTLRRHMEDGCSKRFDIETVDFGPEYNDSQESSSMGGPSESRASDTQHRHASYSSSVHYSPPSVSGSMVNGYLAEDATQDSW